MKIPLSPFAFSLVIAVLSTGCGTSPSSSATSDVPAIPDVPTAATDGGAHTDAGDEFASAPACDLNGFMRLRGPRYMGESIPQSLVMEGRPSLTNGGASSLSLNNAAGNAFLLQFEWSGTLRADQPGDLTRAQIFLPMDQGSSSPPLDGPWSDRRICAGAGSRIVLRRNGMQFILRNATITTSACPGGDALGSETVEGCYLPNIAP